VSTKIVIDCDPGHDDAMAILLALASPEVELIGVTTVAGNQTLDKTTPNALKVLELHPDAKPERVVWMGGSIGEGNTTPAAEFNSYVDPEAAQRVFQSGLPDVTMIGLDVTHRALINDDHRERLRSAGRVGKVAAELLDFYARFHKHRYPDLPGAPLHDPVCVAHVAKPGLVEVKDAYIEVDCAGEQGRGRTNVDWRGRAASGPHNAKVGVDIDGEAFAELVIERIGSLG
jgi:inosine-uridine nucleoside N-ribohydrolase